MNHEQLVGVVMLGVSNAIPDDDMARKTAVERYMRKFLRDLTDSELEVAFKYYNEIKRLIPEIEFKMNQAIRGYDRFMARRKARAGFFP